MVNYYGRTAELPTLTNTQGFFMIEIPHQVLTKAAINFKIQYNYVDEYDPWSGILVYIDFDICSKFHKI